MITQIKQEATQGLERGEVIRWEWGGAETPLTPGSESLSPGEGAARCRGGSRGASPRAVLTGWGAGL